MGKSMIVIDTPENCVKCHLTYYDEYNNYFCSLTGDYIDCYENKSPYCPLSPLPDRINLRQYVDNTACDLGSIVAYQYAQGWNSCIDKILEGENDANKK